MSTPFLSVQNKNFSLNVPRKFMGHKGYYNYRMSPPPKTLKSACILSQDIQAKEKMKMFKYQKFIASYTGPITPYSCLIWHSVGSGKTMTMWQIVAKYIRNWHMNTDKKQIFIIGNPKQLEGFENELVSFDRMSHIKRFLDKRFSKSVRFGDSNKKSRLGIQAKYGNQTTDIILMNFVEASKYAKAIGFKNCVVLVDEAHNLVNPSDTYKRFKSDLKFLGKHLSICVSNNNVKVMPLTATPIREHIGEMGALLNMVSKKIKFPVTESAFIKKYGENIKQLKKDIRGIISYFNRESDLSVQPRKQTHQNTRYGEIYVKLGDHQLKAMKKSKNKPNLLRTQASFSGMGKSAVRNYCTKLDDHLKSYGTKLQILLKNINDKNKLHDKHWVYCGHTRRSGVTPVSESLVCMGWKQIPTNNCVILGKLKKVLEQLSHGKSVTTLPGKDYKRFVVLESSTPKSVSRVILQIVNHCHNVAGKLIRVIVGDRSRKEGMDLFSIKHVHVVSPDTKYSDWHQAISRAIRYCSFKYVPNIKDWNVNIYTYIATNNNRSPMTIDQINMNHANKTYDKTIPYIQAFKEGAVDCEINKGMHKIEKLKCDMRKPVILPGNLKNNTNKIPSIPKASNISKNKSKKKPKIKLKIIPTNKNSVNVKINMLNSNNNVVLKKHNTSSFNPFLGNAINKSNALHIKDLIKTGYNNAYMNFNYNKAYQKGLKLKRKPFKKRLPNLSNVKNKYNRNRIIGARNAEYNAMMNGFKNR